MTSRIHQLFAILLLPFLVVGNSLSHAHAIASHHWPGKTRAHIHLAGGPHSKHHDHELRDEGSHRHSHDGHQHGHSHQHGHGQQHDHGQHNHHDGRGSDGHGTRHQSAANHEPNDHDSDAVYFFAADCLFTVSKCCLAELDSQDDRSTESVYPTLASLPTASRTWPYSITSELPLYLLHVALRL